jgi:hypothetical protein
MGRIPEEIEEGNNKARTIEGLILPEHEQNTRKMPKALI